LPKGFDLKEIIVLKPYLRQTRDIPSRGRGRELLIVNPSIAAQRRKVEVREHFDGEKMMKFNGRYLNYRWKRRLKSQLPDPKKRGLNTSIHQIINREGTSLHYNSYL